jgi:hypothetical protein
MFSIFISFLVGFVVVVSVAHGYDDGATYSVKCRSGQTLGENGKYKPRQICELVSGQIRHPNSHAYGTFVDDVNKDGWGKIWVHGDSTVDGWYQSGYLEGALTSKRVYQHYTSWYNYQFGSSPLTNGTINFMYEQYGFAKRLSEREGEDDQNYYLTLKKLLAQFQGILDGVNDNAENENEKLSLLDLLLLEAAGDLYDIIPAVNPSQFKLHVGKLGAQQFEDEWHNAVSCSAIIKIKDDLSDVYAGHNSWTSYQNMLRIYKNYDLDGGNYKTSHSSKPGVIYSKDDFYVLPRHNLVVMETTNGVMNPDLYKFVTPRSLLTWQRLPMVNTLATNGKEWVNIVSKYNSGTYANQWMVLDMKLFEPGKGVTTPDKTDFLWIVELAPGVAVANDVTKVMLDTNQGYWPSYNIPYDEKVYVVSGFQAAYEKYGDAYSYSKCSRAQIFARNQSEANSFENIRSLLRYNDFQNDPLSAGNPTAAISSRYDLRTSSARTYGGVDTKVTSFHRVMQTNKGEVRFILVLFPLCFTFHLIFVFLNRHLLLLSAVLHMTNKSLLLGALQGSIIKFTLDNQMYLTLVLLK